MSLRLWDMRCRYCRDPAVSWLQGAAIAAAGGAALLFLMRAL